jgi:hypothetical protein
VAIAVPVDGQGVHSMHHVTGGHERPHQQPAVDLDAEHDLGRLLGV